MENQGKKFPRLFAREQGFLRLNTPISHRLTQLINEEKNSPDFLPGDRVGKNRLALFSLETLVLRFFKSFYLLFQINCYLRFCTEILFDSTIIDGQLSVKKKSKSLYFRINYNLLYSSYDLDFH